MIQIENSPANYFWSSNLFLFEKSPSGMGKMVSVPRALSICVVTGEPFV